MKLPSKTQLRSWIYAQPPNNVGGVIRAYMEHYWNDPLSEFLAYIREWMDQHGIERSQTQPHFNKAKLDLAENDKLAGDSKKNLLDARSAVFRDRLLSSGYCTSVSHAYFLARQPTTPDVALAKIKAEVFGGIWPLYYRRPQQPGRRRKLVDGMMRLRPRDASFGDFARFSELPYEIGATVARMAEHDDSHIGDRYADESEFLDVADKRGVDTDVARLAWTYYQEWAVEMMAGNARNLIRAARNELEEKISGELDFG